MPIEIDADAGMSIETEGNGNRQRFAHVFRQVWIGVPATDREAMVAHWISGIVGQDHSPQIELHAAADKPGNNDGFGNTLTFNSCVAELLAEVDLLADLIAHELGHVYCFATNASAHSTFPPNTEAKEDEADATAVRWGLRHTSLT